MGFNPGGAWREFSQLVIPRAFFARATFCSTSFGGESAFLDRSAGQLLLS
jgi:hypothetical protein